MKSFKNYVTEREIRRTGGSPENAEFHSRNYRRYFEGYSEYKETGTGKKGKIKRVYTGLYHTASLSDTQRNLLRVTYCLFWLLALLLFLFAATRYVSSNSAFYVAAAQALSVAGFGWMGWSVFNYITAGKNLTSGEYRYVRALKNSSRLAAFSLIAAAAATIFHLLYFQEQIFSELLCAAALLLSGLLCLAVYLIETHILYEVSTAEQAASPDASQISF